mgnify:CR=1 FL=1
MAVTVYDIDYRDRISIQNGNPNGDIFSRDATTTVVTSCFSGASPSQRSIQASSLSLACASRAFHTRPSSSISSAAARTSAGQSTVQFSGANYSAEAFMFGTKYEDYIDETIYFTDKPSLVNTFKTKYDGKPSTLTVS